MTTRTWEPLPPCSDCGEIVEQLNRRMPQIFQSMTAEEIIVEAFYPDSNPETSTVDGHVETTTAAGTSWADIRTGAGTAANDTSTIINVTIRCDGTVDRWDICRRGVATFDLTDYKDRQVESGELRLRSNAAAPSDDFGGMGLVLLQATLASPTAIAAGDFDNFGNTELGTRVLFEHWDQNAGGTFYFNSIGLEYLHLFLGQVVRYGFKINADYDNVEPTWSAGDWTNVSIPSSENTDYTGPQLILRFRE